MGRADGGATVVHAATACTAALSCRRACTWCMRLSAVGDAGPSARLSTLAARCSVPRIVLCLCACALRAWLLAPKSALHDVDAGVETICACGWRVCAAMSIFVSAASPAISMRWSTVAMPPTAQHASCCSTASQQLLCRAVNAPSVGASESSLSMLTTCVSASQSRETARRQAPSNAEEGWLVVWPRVGALHDMLLDRGHAGNPTRAAPQLPPMHQRKPRMQRRCFPARGRARGGEARGHGGQPVQSRHDRRVRLGGSSTAAGMAHGRCPEQ
eukprot:363759-Chlamydomonas_euryale.AAC.17